MSEVLNRFLQYAKVHTQSNPTTGTTPSTPCQLVLAELLCNELNALGVTAKVDCHGYVYGAIPATPGCENAPTLGFVAHMDTAPDFSGENVSPIVHENYAGGDIALPKGGRVISVASFPVLEKLVGKTIITADGTTLLGADDKAGVAEIVTACADILQSGTPHGALRIAFTPDEEIGEGADHFDVSGFGADFAYTMDGGAVGGIEYENFNAASAKFTVEGVSVHPGSAKGVMQNAALIGAEICAMLPTEETPATTDGYDGFYHLTDFTGDVCKATIDYIVRDHDKARFAARKTFLQHVADTAQTAHPNAKISLLIKDSYFNMAEKIAPCMHLIENAQKAAKLVGAVPVIEPIRGGTDGARLSYEGLPCPNLGTGGYNFHGPYEFAVVEEMQTAVELIKKLVSIYAEMT